METWGPTCVVKPEGLADDLTVFVGMTGSLRP
jgi:hypothetical protein